MSNELYITTVQTPGGPLTVICDGSGTVRASGFTAEQKPVVQLLAEDLRGLPLLKTSADDESAPTVGAAIAAQRYASGDLEAFNSVPVNQEESPTIALMRVALRKQPAGEPCSYGELAAAAGKPKAARVAGQACSRNAVAPFVPCHRVVRADGSVGEFAWGADVKRALLDFESGEL